MSDGDASYPPSDIKCERLRRQGVIPRTSILTSFAVLFGFVLFLAMMWPRLAPEVIAFAESSFEGTHPLATLVERGMRVCFSALGFAIGLIVFCVLVVDIVQNKALFSFGALRFAPGAAFAFAANLRNVWQQFASQLLIAFVAVSATVGALSLIALYAFQELISSDTLEMRLRALDTAIEPFGSFGLVVLVVGVATILFVGIFAWFVEVLAFRRVHRMTRAELEQEFKEFEPSPEFTRARRQFRDTLED